MQLKTYQKQLYDRQIQVHNNIYCISTSYTSSLEHPQKSA